jgi:hypothetical protein
MWIKRRCDLGFVKWPSKSDLTVIPCTESISVAIKRVPVGKNKHAAERNSHDRPVYRPKACVFDLSCWVTGTLVIPYTMLRSNRMPAKIVVSPYRGGTRVALLGTSGKELLTSSVLKDPRAKGAVVRSLKGLLGDDVVVEDGTTTKAAAAAKAKAKPVTVPSAIKAVEGVVSATTKAVAKKVAAKPGAKPAARAAKRTTKAPAKKASAGK